MRFSSPLWVALYVDVLTCVCVNCSATVCYIYLVRGSVVGKVLCDEGLKLRKGLWQRLKDRKERRVESKQLAFQTLTSWNSHQFLPLSLAASSPSISLQLAIQSNLLWLPGALLWNALWTMTIPWQQNVSQPENYGRDVHLFINNKAVEWKFTWWVFYLKEGRNIDERM